MERSKVNTFLVLYKGEIPDNKVMLFKSLLEKADDEYESALSAVKMINSSTILLVSVFLGSLGIDRFMLGDIGLGVMKLLFGWFTLGIWPLIDIFFCYKKARNNCLQEKFAQPEFTTFKNTGKDKFSNKKLKFDTK